MYVIQVHFVRRSVVPQTSFSSGIGQPLIAIDYQYSPTHSVLLTLIEHELNSSDQAEVIPAAPLFVQINGNPTEIFETLEQFAWLSSAFRFPAENSTGLSHVELRVVSGTLDSQGILVELRLSPIRNESVGEAGTCWISLMGVSNCRTRGRYWA